MLRGFYTAASGILSQQRTLEVLTNNIANLNTPGFRASRVVTSTFEHELLTRIEGENTGRIGTGDPIRLVSEVPTRFDPSSLEETGRPYDLAIDGLGYFNIQAPEDEAGNEGAQYLTRNGNFDVDEEGRLNLPGVGFVLGENGPIELESADFTVGSDGTLYDAAGDAIDKLLLTIPPEGTEITQLQNGLYRTEDMEANEPVDESTQLVQGWIERSNIDLNREYTLVIEAQRAFQACSTALQIIDNIDQRAATQIASV